VRSLVVVAALTCAAGPARAESRAAGNREPALAALAPADDARKAIAIGPAGQVYAPDGKGAWVRTTPITTADRIQHVARAGAAILAYGEGVVYRLAPNGWSALRLHQKGKAVMSAGTRAVAAVGRQLFALDRSMRGDPAKLAVAPAPALAIGAGPLAIVIATERGLFRAQRGAFTAIPRAPRRVERLLSDRWALLDRAALDLRTGKTLPWPAGLTVDVATPVGENLAAAAVSRAGVELVVLAGSTAAPRGPKRRPARASGKLRAKAGPRSAAASPASPLGPGIVLRELIAGTSGAVPVGIVVDGARRATIALADGRLAVRDASGAWTLIAVADALPPPRTGPPPATSP
jgi:hypothetical protein